MIGVSGTILNRTEENRGHGREILTMPDTPTIQGLKSLWSVSDMFADRRTWCCDKTAVSVSAVCVTHREHWNEAVCEDVFVEVCCHVS